MEKEEIAWEKTFVREETKRRIKYGYIQRIEHCENCKGTEDIEVHHYNYNDPSRIRFLCRKCHLKWHKLYKPIEPIAGNTWESVPRVSGKVHKISKPTNQQIADQMRREVVQKKKDWRSWKNVTMNARHDLYKNVTKVKL